MSIVLNIGDKYKTVVPKGLVEHCSLLKHLFGDLEQIDEEVPIQAEWFLNEYSIQALVNFFELSKQPEIQDFERANDSAWKSIDPNKQNQVRDQIRKMHDNMYAFFHKMNPVELRQVWETIEFFGYQYMWFKINCYASTPTKEGQKVVTEEDLADRIYGYDKIVDAKKAEILNESLKYYKPSHPQPLRPKGKERSRKWIPIAEPNMEPFMDSFDMEIRNDRYKIRQAGLAYRADNKFSC